MRVIPIKIVNIKSNPYVNKSKTASETPYISADSIEISQEAKALMEVSTTVRTDKVEKVKSLIENGTYKVSSYDTANKILKDIKMFNEFNPPRK